MKTKLMKATRILAAFAVLGAIIACGGSDDDSNNNTTTTGTEPAQGVAAAQPAAGAAPGTLQLGAAPAALSVPIPPSFNFTVATAAEYQLDVSASDGDPRMFVYQGDTLVEDNDDGGEGNNARVVRFLTPGTYSIRVTEFRARAMSAQVQAAQLQELTPVGAITVGQPLVVQFPEFGWQNMPKNNREAAKAVTLTVAAAGQYSCTATMDNDRRVEMALVQNGSVVASDDQGYNETNASITQQLQPGQYIIRVWDTIRRGETRATINCTQG